MRRLAALAVALLAVSWQSSPSRMTVAAQPLGPSPPPPNQDDDDEPPTTGLPLTPPPQPLGPSPPPPNQDDDDEPPTTGLPLTPPGEFDSPESPLPDSSPPPTAPSPPRREPTPPRMVVPPQEPSWAALPPPAPPKVTNYTATGYTTMLVFGDSTVDPGNNNRLQTALKANFLPYGMSFLGGRPTGRFSNGRLITDILAEKLGIARSIPGFLDPKLKPQQLRRGVSFASAGSGYDDATARRSVCRYHNLRFHRRQTNEKLQQEQN